MNVLDAAYAVVHDYPGGSESLAPRIGMSPAVLRNKVNANCATHHLTLQEASSITGITEDLRIAHAFAAAHGRVLITPAFGEDVSDMAVLEVMAAMWSTNGELGTAVHHALADGVLTDVELQHVRDAAYALQARIAGLIQRMEAMAEPGVPGNA